MSMPPRVEPQSGFTLLEALVTIIIISIGLLGVLKLQSIALVGTQISESRSWATIAADDIAERIRANPQGAADQDYVAPELENAGNAPEQRCEDSACLPREMARLDLWEWRRTLETALPDGKGAVECSRAEEDQCREYTIFVAWHEHSQSGQNADSSPPPCRDGDQTSDRCFKTVVRP